MLLQKAILTPCDKIKTAAPKDCAHEDRAYTETIGIRGGHAELERGNTKGR